MKEKELAQKFVEYLSCYDLYFEVEYFNCVDIVAVNDNLSIAYEVKTSFSFKVFEQALRNKQHFNYSYIAVPASKDTWIQEKLCKDYGIGLLMYFERKKEIREIVHPKLNRYARASHLLTRLHDYNKRSMPGTRSGDSEKITAFTVTVEKAVFYVGRHPGCTIKQMISEIDHHYDSDKSACSNIYTWIRKGVIKELRLENGKLFKNNSLGKAL